MKFINLHITNFLSIGEAEIRLADRGLTLLQGINEDDSSADSNGSGKSSVADALCWNLYGTTARGEEGDKIVNRTAGKDCRVALTIDDDGESYQIVRHRKHKTGKNSLTVSKDGGVTDLTKGTDKLTQALVQQIIGSSYEVFRSSIYAGQESFPDLPNMTDKQLKMLVEEASGVTILERAYEEARTRHAEVKARADKLTTVKERCGQRISDNETNLASAEERREQFEEGRARDLAHVASTAKVHVEAVKVLDAAIAGSDEAGIKARIEACDAAIASVNGEIAKERSFQNELSGLDRSTTSLRTQLTSDQGRVRPRQAAGRRHRAPGRLPLHLVRPRPDRGRDRPGPGCSSENPGRCAAQVQRNEE